MSSKNSFFSYHLLVISMKMKSGNKMYKFLTRMMILFLIVLGTMIVFKANPTLKSTINQKVFNNNFNFAKVNEIYEKFFGSPLPSKEENKKTEEVFNETLEYSSSKKYKDGVELTVKENYVVNALDSGIVIFAGEKEGYGKTIIIQEADKTEVWYSNLKNLDTSIYDYIKKGTAIGSADGTKMYLAFQKDGKFLDYKKYL